jgi:aminodeoxyfutalosine synthase
MPGPIPGARLRDPRLHPIADKVTAGERLSPAEGVALYQTTDLLGLGTIADFANRRRNGDRVFFSANQHINPTNVCVLRNTCVFCSFARMPKEDGAYTRSLEEVYHEAEQARGMPTREFHIVGGLHPKLRLSYYTDMIRGLGTRRSTSRHSRRWRSRTSRGSRRPPSATCSSP